MSKHDALPAYLKVRLQKADSSIGADDAPLDDEMEVESFDDNAADESHGAEAELPDDEVQDVESDKDKSWKGRLKKVQEENERLKLAAQNGRFVAEKLIEMQEREKQKDEELAQLRSRLDEKNRLPEEQGESLFSADERDALSMELGDEALRVLEAKLTGLRGQNVSAQVQALQDELRRRDEQSRRNVWFETMKAQIPEIQGLLQSNGDFIAFLQDKRDFSGRSAFDVVEQAGNDLDVEKIPLIRSWIDEFKSGSEKVKRKATVRPLAGGGHTHEVGRKPKAGKREWAARLRLKQTGQRAELEKLIEKFDWS